jgi:hypothetical protein
MAHRFIFFPLLFIAVGCVDDAPRDNPLDPLSPSYAGRGSLIGRVIVNGQSSGIPGAVIEDTNTGLNVVSDSAGYFHFNGLPEGVHRFICTKQNFVADTFDAQILPYAPADILLGLNGLPVVAAQNILTRKIDQYFPSPQYFVEIEANVSDPNSINDLDSVWFTVDSLNFPLSYSLNTKNFVATIYKYQLPTNTIQWLVGKPLRIIARDVGNAVGSGAPFYVTRVIENTATPKYPSSFNNDTTDAAPVFQWLPPDVTFNYTYTISLSRMDGGIPVPVWSIEGIDSFYEQFSYPVGSAPVLTPGPYAWSISVVDEFGNYARSKESAFFVQ